MILIVAKLNDLLQWAWLIAKKSIFELKRQDIQDYIEFCLNPPKSWIGLKRVTRFIESGGIRTANQNGVLLLRLLVNKILKKVKSQIKIIINYHKNLFVKYLPY